MNRYIEYERWTFPAEKIIDGNIHLASSLLSSSLEVNSFYAEVECDDPAILKFRRNTQLLYYESEGQPMVFRLQNIERVGPRRYKLSATSTLGLLTEGLHYGGIYAGQTAEDVISSICGTVPYIVKSSLKEIKLYGWLPIAAPRDNLGQVLFAIGATLKTDLDGVLRIEDFWDGVSRSVGADRMYLESTVGYTAAVTSVVVTEHQYIQGSEEESLYEGVTQQGDIITFNEPMHSLTSEGFAILAHGANWAKLTAGAGVLRGKKYIHNTREVERKVADAYEPNVKRVKDATLVSFFNSDGVARRLANFFQRLETINAPIIYRDELPGDCIDTFHPFDHVGVVACLQSADITLSNTLKAQGKILVGFVPDRVSNTAYYDARDVILKDGTWTVPAGVNTIRVVLIGGGDGGLGGQDGGDSYNPNSEDYPNQDYPNKYIGGYGGAAGAGGNSGLVYQFSLDVVPGEIYSVVIGKGGNGGAPYGHEGPARGLGAQTTFKRNAAAGQIYSSASGERFLDGFHDPMTNEIYALRGPDGIGGGKGGSTSKIFVAGGRGEDGEPAHVESDPGVPYLGGYGGNGVYNPNAINDPTAFGGGGGGGSFGQRGENGGNGTVYPLIVAGNGGNGGSPPKPGTPSRGSGGGGGHGGGGGGGNGIGGNDYGLVVHGTPGKGGSGSQGGDGGDGIAIIYYRQPEISESGQFVDRNGKAILGKYQRRFVV